MLTCLLACLLAVLLIRLHDCCAFDGLACLLATVPLRLLPSAATRILVRDSAQPGNTYSEGVCVFSRGVATLIATYCMFTACQSVGVTPSKIPTQK